MDIFMDIARKGMVTSNHILGIDKGYHEQSVVTRIHNGQRGK